MILEIALGIVLAVIILALLPVILPIALLLVVLALLVGFIALLFAFNTTIGWFAVVALALGFLLEFDWFSNFLDGLIKKNTE